MGYALSYLAMMEFAYHVIGIGGAVQSMDLTAITLMQIKRSLEDLKKMVQIVLDTPLLTALDKLITAMNLLQNHPIDEAIEKFRRAEDDAHTAFHYSQNQGKQLNNLRDVFTAKKIILLAKLCILSYDKNNQIIEPFYVLGENKQRAIAIDLERDCQEFLDHHSIVKVRFFSLGKGAKNYEMQSMKNTKLCIRTYLKEKSTPAEKENSCLKNV